LVTRRATSTATCEESSITDGKQTVQNAHPMPGASAAAHSSSPHCPSASSEVLVRHFRQILMWPLRVTPGQLEGTCTSRHWQALQEDRDHCPWHEVLDEFGDPESFQERHYKEFITFLPFVQRFLYGMGKAGPASSEYAETAIRVFRRDDVTQMRLVLDQSETPQVFQVAHVDLYFFYDTDIIVLVVEFFADDLPLSVVQNVMFKTGRAYPAYWESNGQGAQCPHLVEWILADGRSAIASDYEDRRKYLEFACAHRSPHIAAHWQYLLEPLTLYLSDSPARLRFRQIEYHRMPLVAYLSFDDPKQLTRGDFARLALVTQSGAPDRLPFSTADLVNFEQEYCYDRFWDPDDPALSSRYLCSGHALVFVGQARSSFFAGTETGMLGQFRHQYFLMALIAHFHKAALMVYSEWLVTAIGHLDMFSPESLSDFKREIRGLLASFLRFTERYWFHVISAQAQVRDLYRMLSRHLDTDRLYQDVSTSIKEMHQYLDSDSLRRQASTVVRLTVVTTLGLIATVSTGFLGMNIIDAASEPLSVKLAILLAVLIPSMLLVNYAVANAEALSDFLEALANKRLSWWQRTQVLIRAWRDPRIR